MAVNPELLEILVCPKSKAELRLVPLPERLQQKLAEKFSEHFPDETPTVTEGLLCDESQLLYPIVADIPVMLIEEALPADVLQSE